jgi:hypothetical protein
MGRCSTSPLDHGGHEVHRRRADEPGHEQVDRLLVQHARRIDLLEHALAQHGHPVAEGHGLDLVMGDVHRGDAQPVLQARDLGAHLEAQLGVEVRQRLVEEEGIGLTHDRPPHRHPLALPARQLGRLAVEEVLQLEQLGDPVDPAAHLVVGQLAQTQGEGDGPTRIMSSPSSMSRETSLTAAALPP